MRILNYAAKNEKMTGKIKNTSYEDEIEGGI